MVRAPTALVIVASMSCGRLGFEPGAGGIDEPAVIQNGRVTFTNENEALVTIAPVPARHSMLVFTVAVDYVTADDTKFSGQMLRDDLLQFKRSGTSAAAELRWYVVTWPAFHVQRGEAQLESGTVPVTLSTAVDRTRSFAMITGSSNGDDLSNDDFVRAELVSDRRLDLSLGDDANESVIDVAWQVIEVEGAVAHHGRTTIASGTSQATATIPDVDLARTMIVSSSSAAGGDPMPTAHRMLAVDLPDPVTARFARGLAGPQTLDIAWSVVELPRGNVQRGVVPFGAVETNRRLPVTAVDVALAFPLLSGFNNTSGSTDYSANDNPGPAWTAASLVDAGTLELHRALAGANALVPWTIVEL